MFSPTLESFRKKLPNALKIVLKSDSVLRIDTRRYRFSLPLSVYCISICTAILCLQTSAEDLRMSSGARVARVR